MTTTHEISAIPTVYNGVQLKSRMEAKCALLFDKLGWKWEYEPFSVMLDGINYMPDFYIPEFGYVVECRGYDSEKGREQIKRFSETFPGLKIPHLSPFQFYAVIGPSEALVFDKSHVASELCPTLCGHCGRWKLKDCDCAGYIERDLQIRVSDGEIYVGTKRRPSSDWQDCAWTLFEHRFSGLWNIRERATALLRQSMAEHIADEFDKVKLVCINLKTCKFRIDVRTLRSELPSIRAAILLATGCDPTDYLLEGEVKANG